MAAGAMERRAVEENLFAADMDEADAARFVRCWENGDTEEQLAILARHRGKLLERLHAEQRRIDCLDYLVYTISSAGH